MIVSEKTIYNYIESGALSVKNIDLPRKVKYKIRKTNNDKHESLNAEIYEGRTYKDFLDYYDKRRVDIGSLRPIETPDGVVLNGTIDIRGVMLNIFTYDEYFVDLDGQTKAFLPAGTMAMLTPGLGKTAYGQVSFVQGEVMKSYADRIIPRIVADENTSIIEVQEFSRPVPYPEFIDGWVVADATKAN